MGSPHKGDWVGVYSPADADVHSTAPVKWQHADVVRLLLLLTGSPSHEIKSTRVVTSSSPSSPVTLSCVCGRQSAEYLRTGAGKLRFRLINMRASYVFHFMRNGTTHPVLVSSSNQGTAPQQHPRIHQPPSEC